MPSRSVEGGTKQGEIDACPTKLEGLERMLAGLAIIPGNTSLARIGGQNRLLKGQ